MAIETQGIMVIRLANNGNLPALISSIENDVNLSCVEAIADAELDSVGYAIVKLTKDTENAGVDNGMKQISANEAAANDYRKVDSRTSANAFTGGDVSLFRALIQSYRERYSLV